MKRLDPPPNGRDYLLPSERGLLPVWRGLQWRELWTLVAALAWLLGMWLWWCQCGERRPEGAGEHGVGFAGRGGTLIYADHSGAGVFSNNTVHTSEGKR